MGDRREAARACMGLRHLVGPDEPMSPAMRSETTTWDEACEACAAKILGVETVAEVRAALKEDDAPQGGAVHPCAKCGVMRTEAEGCTTFTVCDECWDAKHGAPRGVMEEIADLKRRLAAFSSEPAGWQVVSALGVAVDIRDSSSSAHFHMDRLNESRIDGRPYTVCPVYRGPA